MSERKFIHPCDGCASLRHTINGRYCEVLNTKVQYKTERICEIRDNRDLF